MSDSTERSEGTPKFCPQCGTPVKRLDAKFCSQCGKNFSSNVSGSTQPIGALPVAANPVSASQGPSYSTNTGSTQPPPLYGRGYREQSQPAQRSWNMTTPNDIRPVTGKLFTREEYRTLGFFTLVAYLSHFFRYLLLFNEFPEWQYLLLPIPMYIIAVPLIFIIQKWFTRDKGVQMDLTADEFDYNRSLVFSSFFLTLLPPRYKINTELSNLPEKITLKETTPQGLVYREATAAKYVGSVVRPRMHFFSGLVITLLAILTLSLYVNAETIYLSTTLRLVTLYIISFQMVELAPIFGRNNDKSADYAKIRTLLLFLVVLIVFVLALLGEGFYLALQERF